ncbi:MAG: DegT/DnrJ/EryC1/StrS family aminotransferase, partial [Candidatus Omnitrophica bacterium]|nr:DegT/DnrJ/EryC1/StrS family aminotransferase [Candidatus Omnitrophota bacterium]
MIIPLTDLKIQYEGIRDEIDSGLKEVISETNFILGKQVSLLEEEIARYIGIRYAVGVASGTDALVLSLLALGIGKDDEVITTPFTFIATAEAVVRVGAKPIFCDIDYKTYNIDVTEIEKKITKRTKAIIPVHLYGLPCDMDGILTLARKYNLKVIEDCAQSFGAEYKGKKTGSFADCGCFSFFPGKNLGCYGDGGMVVTNNEEIAQRLRCLRNHGSITKYYYAMHGFNSRLDTLQAVVLRIKLKYIDKWINQRIQNAKLYNELLSNIESIVTPVAFSGIKHVFNYYTIRIKDNKRDKVQQKLKENNIAYATYYPLCLHLQDVYKDLGYKRGDFPMAEEAQDE